MLLPLPPSWLLFLWIHVMSAMSMWLPLLVISSGFRKMGQMLKFYFDLVC